MKPFQHIKYFAAVLLAGSLFTGLAQAQTGSQSLQGNNIKARFNANGDLFWDGKNAHFEVGNTGRHTISASALWIGGLDSKGELHLSAQTYRESGSDFWPGPLDENGNITPETSAQYDKVWKITKLQVDSLRLGIGVPQAVLDWPQAAPYIDVDKNGLYEPLKGDYPDVTGDEMLWWVFNDNLEIHTETGGEAMGIEIQAKAFTFNCLQDPILNNTVFLSYKIINKSGNNYDSVYAGMWADFDIGNLFDDYVGTMPSLNTIYGYNADAFDADTVIKSKSGSYTYNGFGKQLPVQSLTFLKGLQDDFGKPMNISYSMYYNNDVSSTGNPNLPIQYYNLLRGRWLTTKWLTEGGTGYEGSNKNTPFMFPGNVADGSGWTEVSAKNPAGDRRALASFGPVKLAAGQAKEFTVAYLYNQSTSGFTNRSLAVMQNQVQNLIQLYNNNTLQPCTGLTNLCLSGDSCVWPGDANADGKVQMNDIFHIGFGYNATGPNRIGANNSWNGQRAQKWAQNFPDGTNYSHADANGDGIIDSSDVLPIILNYEQTHSKKDEITEATLADPLLKFEIDQDTAAPGSVITGTLALGSIDLPVEDVLGLTVRLTFDPELLEPATMEMNAGNGVLGKPEELVSGIKYDFEKGYLDFGIVRNSKTGKKVGDIIIKWKYVIDPNVHGNKQSQAKVDHVEVVNSKLEKINVNVEGDQIFITANPLSVKKPFKNISADVNLYPNPAATHLNIELKNTTSAQIKMYNMQGQMVQALQQNGGVASVDVSHFPAGIYIVEIQTAEGRTVKKFSKLR